MIQVINRAFDILEFIARNGNKQLGLSDIADSVELNHSTCANILKTLINRGYVEKTQGYSLGPKAFTLYNSKTEDRNLLEVAKKFLKSLKNKTNESCILAILQDNIRVTVHKELTEHELQAITRDEKNAFMTATGRILIANLKKPERTKYLKKYGQPGQMWPEIKDEVDLTVRLDKIVQDKITFHYADSEIIGLAVPLVKNNIVEASIGIYLPVSRFTKDNKDFLINQLQTTAEEINNSL